MLRCRLALAPLSCFLLPGGMTAPTSSFSHVHRQFALASASWWTVHTGDAACSWVRWSPQDSHGSPGQTCMQLDRILSKMLRGMNGLACKSLYNRICHYILSFGHLVYFPRVDGLSSCSKVPSVGSGSARISRVRVPIRMASPLMHVVHGQDQLCRLSLLLIISRCPFLRVISLSEL